MVGAGDAIASKKEVETIVELIGRAEELLV